MKFAAAVILALPAVASAFAPASRPAFGARNVALDAVVTGPKGKAAKSAEEDLELTYKVIMAHVDVESGVEEPVAVPEPESVAEVVEEPEREPIDISIPYDAAAKLAYEASDKSMAYADFKVKYEEDAVADVVAKYVDLSIPYDAAAKLAYEASDKSMAYADFKVKYEEDAVADVMAKYVDLSIPYDAAAKLAYEASDKSMAYADFKVKYEEDAVSDVKAKYAPEPEATPAGDDVSIPYDAAAQLAYEASDKSATFDDFKAKYEAETVAMVSAKKAARDA